MIIIAIPRRFILTCDISRIVLHVGCYLRPRKRPLEFEDYTLQASSHYVARKYRLLLFYVKRQGPQISNSRDCMAQVVSLMHRAEKRRRGALCLVPKRPAGNQPIC